MRRLLILFFVAGLSYSFLHGQSSHLLLLLQGDGAVTSASGANPLALKKASFLPKDQMISVRPRSGIETLASGFQFRFGADTRFLLSTDEIELNEGSLMIRSRKITNSVVLSGPESKVRLNGSGCYLIEVETNGGLKIVTVLGRLDLIDLESGDAFDLLPGELVFVMPGGRGFAEKVSVNLSKLIKSSYLVSGFPNIQSFQSSLEGVASAQAESIGVTYGAEVGDAKSADSFEVVPTQSKVASPQSIPSKPDTSNYLTDTDPLVELLGRTPKRMKPVNKEESVLNNENLQSPEIFEPEGSRPFPSRLLRKN